MALELKIGDKVWVRPGNYRSERLPFEATVTRVGRKYFEIDKGFGGRKYYVSNGAVVSNYVNQEQIYLSLQEIWDEREHSRLSDELARAFDYYGRSPYNLDQLRRILEIVKEDGAKDPTISSDRSEK